MYLRKALISALAAACALSLLIPAAFAHGCHGGSRRTQPAQCGLCTVEGCELTGRHTHDGVTCCGYDHAGGVCGGACLPLCTVEGCTLTGRHTHDGVTCCGTCHEEGFCDGTCPAAVVPAASGRHHHGGHH